MLETTMSPGEKEILCMMVSPEPQLPFPLVDMHLANGDTEKEYVIPDEQREQIFEELFPFVPRPDLDDVMLDIHENKTFVVRDFRVLRWEGRNLLVSPYYPHSGGMVVDWMEAN